MYIQCQTHIQRSLALRSPMRSLGVKEGCPPTQLREILSTLHSSGILDGWLLVDYHKLATCACAQTNV